MSFKSNSGYIRIFVDKDGNDEVLKAELDKNGVKTIVTLAEV